MLVFYRTMQEMYSCHFKMSSLALCCLLPTAWPQASPFSGRGVTGVLRTLPDSVSGCSELLLNVALRRGLPLP